MSDQSSFASILAGVQRMRDEAGGSASDKAPLSSETNLSTVNVPKKNSQMSTAPVSSVLATSSDQQKHAITTPFERRRAENRTKTTSVDNNLNNFYRRVPSPTLIAPISSPNSESTNGTSTSASTAPRTTPRGSTPPIQLYSSIQVSSSQKGNPLFKDSLMKTALWVFNANILCDYYINPTLQILFLSLKYHKLHPEYVWQRLKKINGGSSTFPSGSVQDKVLKILLVVVDIDLHQESLRQLLDFCIKHDLLLVLSWSFEEAGNYIFFAKQHELSATRQAGNLIKGLQSDSYRTCILNSLTTVPAINKTDVVNLLANFKSFDSIVSHCCEDIDVDKIQGLGARKRANLKQVFTEPFIYNKEYENR